MESSLPAAAVDRLLARRGEVTAVARIREIVMTGRGRAQIQRGCSTARCGASPTRSATGAPPCAGEVTLGRGALDALDARIGERVALRAGGQPVSLRVVGRHVEPDDDGRGAVTSLRGCPRASRSATTPTGACAFSPGADPWRPPRH